VRVSYLSPAWAFDPRDDNKLMRAATDVFVGTVVARVGTAPLSASQPGVALPQTQFAVKVQRKIKGGARGTITVNQLGGVDPAVQTLVLFEGDRLLVPGEKVLLITEYDATLGWYHVIAAGYSHHRIRDDQQEVSLVGRFERAAGLGKPGGGK
jgi:hypothetical protein